MLGGTGECIGSGRGLAPEAGQRRHRSRVGTIHASGKDFVPEEVPRPLSIGVRRILAPVCGPLQQKRTSDCAGDVKERTHERHPFAELSRSPHACEPCDPSPAERAVKDRFSLVVSGVGHEDMAPARFPGDLRQKIVSAATGPSLESLAGSFVAAMAHGETTPREGHSMATGEVLDKLAICRGLGAKVVLGMGNYELWNPERKKADQHGHAVGSA